MRIFNVKVNGKMYNVEVEETAFQAPVVNSSPAVQPVAYSPIPAPVSAPVPAPAPQKPAVSVTGGTPVKSPMPGLVLGLLVSDGATVKKNQKILVLEAMKMENDILASADGIISFTSKKGDSVETGTVLAVVK